MRLSQNIAGLRHAAGWSQEELAARLDVTRQSVSKWESGQSVPDAERLVKLSELFGVSVDFLLKGDGPPAGDAPTAAFAARLVTAGEAADYLALRGRAAGRIAAIRAACRAQGVDPHISVDGGINAETGAQCAAAGADWLVAGSTVFAAPDPAAAVAALRAL